MTNGYDITMFGGNCPVQATGKVIDPLTMGCHLTFYFRARGSSWTFGVGVDENGAIDGDVWEYGEPYGDGPYDAGWMPDDEAYAFIRKAVHLFWTRPEGDGKA